MFPPGIPGDDPLKLRREGPPSHRQTRKFAVTLTSSGKETKIGESIDFVVDVAGNRQCWPDDAPILPLAGFDLVFCGLAPA
jgi:hypothetical protein